MKKVTGRNKKLLAGALALSMALPTTVYAGKSLVQEDIAKDAQSGTFLRGDVTGDEKITLDDAAMTLRYALKIKKPETDLQKLAADADGNGEVKLDDAQLILKWALKLKEQPTPEPLATEVAAASETPATGTPATGTPASGAPASETPASTAPASEAPASKKPIVIPSMPAAPSIAPATKTPVPVGAKIPTVAAVDYVVTADAVSIVSTNGATVDANGIYTLTDENKKAGKGIQFQWPYIGRTDLVETLEQVGITEEVIGDIPAEKLLKDVKTFDFTYEYPRPDWNTGVSISFWSKQKWDQEGQSNFTPVLTLKRTAYCDKHSGTSSGGYGDVTNRHGSKGDCDYSLVVCANGSVAFECGDASNNEFRADNYIADKDDEWTFYTVTIANDWITVYINGQELVYQNVDLDKDLRCEFFNAGFMTRYNPAGFISQEMLDKDIRKYLTAPGSSYGKHGAYYQLDNGKWETNWEATLIGNSIYKSGSLTERKQLLMELLTSSDTEMWIGGAHVCTLKKYESNVTEYSTESGAQVAGVQCYASELEAGEVAAVYENSVQQYKDILGLK